MKNKLFVCVGALLFFSALPVKSSDDLDFGLGDSSAPEVIIPAQDVKTDNKRAKTELDMAEIPHAAEEMMAPSDDAVSYFAQALHLDISQMTEAKKISDEGQKMRDSLLHSIFTIKKQAAEYEKNELEKFRQVLRPEQNAQFEKLLAEYNKRRVEMGVLPVNVVAYYHDNMEKVDAALHDRLKEYQDKKSQQAAQPSLNNVKSPEADAKMVDDFDLNADIFGLDDDFLIEE